MKTITTLLIGLTACCCFVQAPAQSIPDKKSELIIALRNTIEKHCHLTELSENNCVEMSNRTITVAINFDNKSLRSFWSPEVAVQYIFDAALNHLAITVWDQKNNKRPNYDRLKFKVDIRPHDIPAVIWFELALKDWESYCAGKISKETFYKKMLITAEGKPYKFDAHRAVGIE